MSSKRFCNLGIPAIDQVKGSGSSIESTSRALTSRQDDSHSPEGAPAIGSIVSLQIAQKQREVGGIDTHPSLSL